MKLFAKRAFFLIFFVLCLFGISMLTVSAEAVEYDSDTLAVSSGAVARLGDEGGTGYYTSLSEAIGAAQNNETVYLLYNVTETIEIENNSITIEGVDDGITITKGSDVAFKLGGNTASLTLKNLNFEYIGENVIKVGNDSSSPTGMYSINLEDVNINCTASGAIYYYKSVESLNINIADSSFSGDSSDAIINCSDAVTSDSVINMNIGGNGVTLSTGFLEKNSGAKGIITITYTTDVAAIKAGAVARIGDVGGVFDVNYFKSFDAAIAAAGNGGTVYLLTEVTPSTTIEINNKSVTVEGVGDNVTINMPSTKGAAFKLLGNTASLTLRNITFSKYENNSRENFIVFGLNQSTRTGEYSIVLDKVNVTYAASGALYYYNVESVDITIIDSIFTGTSGDAIINSGGSNISSSTVVNMHIAGVTLSDGVDEKNGSAKGTITIEYTTDAAAVYAGAVARIGDVGGIFDVDYFKSLDAAIAAAGNGGTVYLIADITPNKIGITDYAVTIEGVGNVTINRAGVGIPAFNLLGDTASLTLKNITFAGYTSTNVIMFGYNQAEQRGNYTLVLDGVDMTFRASGALYYFNAESVDITIKDSSFTSTQSGDAIINSGGSYVTSDTVVNMYIGGNGVTLSDGVDEKYDSAIGTITITYTTDAAAVYAGAVARIGDVGGVFGEVYYTSLADAIAAAENGETVYLLTNETVESTIEIKDKRITVEGVVDNKGTTISKPGSKVAAFKILGSTASLTIKNVTFAGYTGTNVIMFGEDKSTRVGNYELVLDSVEMTYSASGALYYYNVESIDIRILNSTFNGADTNAIINSGSSANITSAIKVEMYLTNVGRSSGVVEIHSTNKGTVNIHYPKFYANDTVAIADTEAGIVARTGATQGGAVYYASLAHAIAAARDDETVYLLTDITLSTINITNDSVTIAGVGNVTITKSSGVAFKLLGDTASLTLKNITFAGYTSTNIIMFGEDKSTRVGNYELVLDSVEMTYSASGALYYYNVESIDIRILNSTFNGANTNAIINSGSSDNITSAIKVDMYLTNVGRSSGVVEIHTTNKGTVNIHYPKFYADDTVAIEDTEAGIVARIGATQGGAVYYASLADAIAALREGEIIYIITDISDFPVTTISNKSVKIDGGSHTITGATDGKRVAFDMYSGVTLEVNNLNFVSYSGANPFRIGNSSSGRYDYNIKFTNVTCDYNTSGAFYAYYAHDINIELNNVQFSSVASTSDKGVFNCTSTSNTYITGTVNVYYNNKGWACQDSSKSLSFIHTFEMGGYFDNDQLAADAEMVVRVDLTHVSSLGTRYYDSVQKALAATADGKLYIIKNITDIGTVTISGKTVEIVGTSQFEISTTSGKAFSLSGGGDLTIRNLKFIDFDAKNVVVIEAGDSYNYEVTFEDVVCNFRAQGAIYVYAVNNVTIDLIDCTFNADKKDDAAVCIAGAVSEPSVITSTDIILNENAKVLYEKANNVSVEEHYTTDQKALDARIIVVRDNNGNYIPLRIGEEGLESTLYYREITDYLKANLGTNDKTVNDAYQIVYTPNAFVSETTDTSAGIKIGEDEYALVDYDYYGAWRIAMALYGESANDADLPNGQIYRYGDVNITAEKRVYVGVVDETAGELVNALAANEYAVHVADNGDVYLLAWNDKALNAAVDLFLSMIENGQTTLPVGTFEFVVDVNWIVDFEKPDGTLWGNQYMGDNSLQYVYRDYDSADNGKAAFNAYCAELESEGYELVWENVIENNLFCLYKNTEKGIALYVAYNDYTYKDKYYGTNGNDGLYGDEESDLTEVPYNADLSDDYFENRDHQKVIRVVSMPLNSLSIPDTEVNTPDYSYEKVTDTFVTTLSLQGNAVGMGYVYMLEDGSFVVVDGGGTGCTNDDDMTESEAIWEVINAMYLKAHGHEPTQEEPIHISAWYLTHAHWDHFSAFINFMGSYAANITIDYAIANIPVQESLFYNAEISTSHAVIQNYLNLAAGGKRMIVKAQTGQRIYLANLEIEVLMTYGDHAPFHVITTNDTNTVARFKIHNKDAMNGITAEVLYLGDSWRHSSRILCEMYDSYLQTEIVQLAHHGNVGSERVLYKAIAPRAVFFPHNTDNFKGYVYFESLSGGNESEASAFRYAANVWCATNAEYVWSAPYGTYNVLKFGAARPDYDAVYDLFTGYELSDSDYDTAYARTNSTKYSYIHTISNGYKSVNIVWGDLSFTYQDDGSTPGTWNPDTHVYDGATPATREAGWMPNGDNRIFVGNMSTGSSQSVNVTLSFAKENGYENFTGTFTDGGTASLDSMGTKTFTFNLSTETLPETDLENAVIGSVTVTLN